MPSEEIIPKLFDKYPLNCERVMGSEALLLDSMLMKFSETGYCDRRLLEKIIFMLRFPREEPPVSLPIVNRVIELTRNHPGDDVPVSELAQMANVSLYYMAHVFKKVTGCTVTEYRNAMRLTEAKRLLVTTELTVSEIAQQCGFCSAAYLTELFTRSELVPPTEYRKLHKI